MKEVVYRATYNTASLRNPLLGKRAPNPDLCEISKGHIMQHKNQDSVYETI